MSKMKIPAQGNEPSERLLAVDLLRGSAIILMVIFHFGFDLTVFGYTHYNTNTDLEWRIFRAIIVSAFLLAVGMSSYLAYSGGINVSKLTVTLFKLSGVSLFISISSYVLYPESWVYFGIIHFITLALPLSLGFIHHPKTALAVGLIIILGYFSDVLSLYKPWVWALEYLHIPKHTMDLVSFVPWFGVVLLGIVLIHYRYVPNIKSTNSSRSIAFLGRHSLIIYLLHQPILFAIFSGIQQISATD